MILTLISEIATVNEEDEHMQIKMYEVGGKQDVLSGEAKGVLCFTKLVRSVQKVPEPTPLFIDFVDVKAATASFLRESVLKFRNYCLQSQLNLFPVVANANQEILDDLGLALKVSGEAILICALNARGLVSNPQVFGELEEKQRLTFEAVKKQSEVDANTLARTHEGIENIQVTGWNNRLASLAAKGLLMEIKRGRSKAYRTVLEFM
jgi:hypothetical protein